MACVKANKGASRNFHWTKHSPSFVASMKQNQWNLPLFLKKKKTTQEPHCSQKDKKQLRETLLFSERLLKFHSSENTHF